MHLIPKISEFSSTTKRIFFASLLVNVFGYLAYLTLIMRICWPYDYDACKLSENLAWLTYIAMMPVIGIIFSVCVFILLRPNWALRDNFFLILRSTCIYMIIFLTVVSFDLILGKWVLALLDYMV